MDELNFNFGMDDINELAQTINDTGLAVTVIAVFLLLLIIGFLVFTTLLIRSNKKRETQYDELLQETISQNSKFFKSVMGNLEAKERSENPEGLFSNLTTCATLIEEHLKYALAQTKADRVAVYVFHNSQRLLNGSHLLKFSCLNEYALLDRYLMSSQHKDTPIAQVAYFCTALQNDGYFHCPNVDEINDVGFKNWVKQWGYRSMYARAIYNTKGDVMGFVSIDYIKDYIYPAQIDTVVDETVHLADKVTVAIDARII